MHSRLRLHNDSVVGLIQVISTKYCANSISVSALGGGGGGGDTQVLTFSNVITLSLLPGLEIKSVYDNIDVGKVPVAQPGTQ